MRVEPWVERRMAAWECHRSQHNPKGFSSTMPDGVRREMAANEQFILAASRVPLPSGVTDDLLAGLDVERSVRRKRRLDSCPPRRAGRAPCAGRSAANLPEQQSGAEAAPLYRRLADGEQEIIYRLAHALRQAGEPAGAVEADAKLRDRGQHQKSGPERIGAPSWRDRGRRVPLPGPGRARDQPAKIPCGRNRPGWRKGRRPLSQRSRDEGRKFHVYHPTELRRILGPDARPLRGAWQSDERD